MRLRYKLDMLTLRHPQNDKDLDTHSGRQFGLLLVLKEIVNKILLINEYWRTSME